MSRPPVCVKVNPKRFKLRGNRGHKSIHPADQLPAQRDLKLQVQNDVKFSDGAGRSPVSVHCHTATTSCYFRCKEVAVDAVIERSRGCVLGSVDLSSLVNLLWLSLTTSLCCQACEVERKLAADTIMSNERKQRRLMVLGKKEGVFLRLKRTRTGLTDPRTVNVIGKDAFDEVRAVRRVDGWDLCDEDVEGDVEERPCSFTVPCLHTIRYAIC